MQVGYLPDMFGHVAQMPQLLAQFGFDHAVVWRGVPAAIDAPAFWWEAPDGTRGAGRVPRRPGTATAPVLPGDAKELIAQIDGWCRRAGRPGRRPRALDERHRPPPPPGPARPGGGRGQRPPGRLPPRGHLAGRPPRRSRPGPTALPVWTGELRSGARANLLMGVASNRVDVHQAAAAHRAARSSGSPSRSRRSTSRPTGGRPASSTRPGSRSSATRPTTRSAPARSTRWAGPSSTASTRPAPSRRA